MKFQHWLCMAIKELTKTDNPKLDAETLLIYVTGKSRSFILTFSETQLTTSEIKQLNLLLAKRKAGEPIAYLVGEREFWSLPLYVLPGIFIPRPDTECLVEQTLIRLPNRPCRILDLGTGTGAIALALASERPDCKIVAIDLLSDALKLVQRNIKRFGLTNIITQQSSWFNTLDNELYDFIVSNPPYIDAQDLCLTHGDVRFEPRVALVADNNGLAALNHIIITAKQYLHTNGWLIIEHGWKQGEIVRKLFVREKYWSVITYRDYNNNERLTLGRAP